MQSANQTESTTLLSKQESYHPKSRLGSAGRVEGCKALPAACALNACTIGLVAQGAAQLEARLQHRMPLTLLLCKRDSGIALTSGHCRWSLFQRLLEGVWLSICDAHPPTGARRYYNQHCPFALYTIEGLLCEA